MGIGASVKKRPSYPYVGRLKGTSLLVLFISRNRGWVVRPDESFKTGYLSESWEEFSFYPVAYEVAFTTD